MSASRRRGRRRHRSGDFTEVLRQIADHERRITDLEKRINQLRIDGPLRWDVQQIPGTSPPQYQIGVFNEATGALVPLGIA